MRQNEKHLFNDYIKGVLNDRKATFRSINTHIWEMKISKKIFDYFDGYYLEDITIDDIQTFFNESRFKKDGEFLSLRYLKTWKTILNATFKKAILRRDITLNPFDLGFNMPYGTTPKSIERVIPERDIKRLFEACKTNERWKIIIPMLLLTGMRIGELCGLQWDDVDEENKMIYIRRSVSPKYIQGKDGEFHKCGVKIDATKTDESARNLPTHPMVFELLTMWKSHITENQKLKQTIHANHTEKIIFVNYRGELMNYNTLYKRLREFLVYHDLESCGIVFHKLRHSFATQLVDIGIDINIISKLLGHTNIITTSKFYAKVNEAPKKDAIEKHYEYIKERY